MSSPVTEAAPAVVGTLSPAEQRFDAVRRSIGLVAGPVALLAILAWPMPGLSPDAHRLAAIVSLVVVWWITEAIPIPITAVLGPTLAVLFGVANTAEAFAPFADPLIFLFIGSFILSRAVVEHGLDRRIAAGILSVPGVGGSFAAARSAIAVVTVLISAWMSNMVVTAMMLPVTLGLIAAQAGRQLRPDKLTTGLLLVMGFAASIGGMITPVGAAPNLITIGLLDQATGARIGFLTWVAVCLPIAAVVTIALLAVGMWQFPARCVVLPVAVNPGEGPRKWTIGQRNAAMAFLTAVTLWVAPAVLSAIAPEAAATRWFSAHLTEPVAAVIAASLLFLLPVDWANRRFTIDWPQASHIDWGTILLLGGGFSLGRLMFRTGLAERIASGVVDVSGAESLWTITAMATAIGIALSELTSNTAATNMLVPVVISICQVAGVSPVAPALGTCLGASLALMLPISTPSNAIVYGTGLVPIRSMMRFGIVMDVLGFAIIQIGLWTLCPLLGLT